jgi:hypothetical protein
MLYLICLPALVISKMKRITLQLIAIKESLSEYGFAVIDFLNVSQVLKTLVPEEIKTVEGIHLKRYLKTDIFIN